ncbi:MAG: hypothetical protein ACYTXY_26525 [Nostoc sp.]
MRSLTLGVGSFHWEYDHLQEVPEKLVERSLLADILDGVQYKGGVL